MSKLLELLHQLLPTSKDIDTVFFLTADSVIKALCTAGIDVSMIPIPGFGSGDLDDEQLEGIIFLGHTRFHAGVIIIHSPTCSRYCLNDFECQAEHLNQFIRDYRLEMLFDGDVIFLAPESRTLTLFHHEGAFAHVRI